MDSDFLVVFFFTLLVQDFTTERQTVTDGSGSLGSGLLGKK